MENGNGNGFGATFTYGVIVRGELEEINKLISFLKASDLIIAYSKIGQEKLWIKEAGADSDY